MVEINIDYLDSKEDESVVFGGLYMLANTKEDGEIKTKAKATFKELISDKSNYFDIVLENAVNGNSFSNVFPLVVDLFSVEELKEIYDAINPGDKDLKIIDQLFEVCPLAFVKEHLDWFNRYYTLQGIDEKYDEYLDGKERTEEDDRIYNLFEYSPDKDTLLTTFSTDGAVVSFDEAFKCPYDICAQVAYIRYIAGKSGIQEGREAFIKSLLDMSDFDYVVEKKMVLEMAVDLLNRNEIANILNAWGCGKILPAEITADWLLEQFDLYSY